MLRRLAREGLAWLGTRSRERVRNAWHALDRRFRIEKRGIGLVLHARRELTGFHSRRTDGEDALWVYRWKHVREVLGEPGRFAVSVTGRRMRQSIGPFFLGMDPGAATAGEPEAPSYEHDSRAMRTALDVTVRTSAGRQLDGDAWRRLDDIAALARKLSEESVRLAVERKGEVDVVLDLADRVPLAFARTFFGIQEPEGGEGILVWLRAASSYVFGIDVEAKQAAAASGGRAMAEHVLAQVRSRKEARSAGEPRVDHVLDRLIDSAKGDETITRLLVGTLSGTIIPTGWIFIEAVDRLLRLPPRRLAALMRHAADGDRARVRGYVLEAARFFPFPPVLLRRATRSTTIGDRRVEAGTPIVLMLTAASMDWRQFPRPLHFDPERSDEDSLIFGYGTHHCMGRAIGETILTEMATALFATPGLRRASGARGFLEYWPSDAVPDGPYPKHLVLEANGWSA